MKKGVDPVRISRACYISLWEAAEETFYSNSLIQVTWKLYQVLQLFLENKICYLWLYDTWCGFNTRKSKYQKTIELGGFFTSSSKNCVEKWFKFDWSFKVNFNDSPLCLIFTMDIIICRAFFLSQFQRHVSTLCSNRFEWPSSYNEKYNV